jgi:hypothetical protein
MSTSEPTDAAGNPLRQGAGAVARPQDPVDRWAQWTQWAESVEARLRAVCAQAAADHAQLDREGQRLTTRDIPAMAKGIAASVREIIAEERAAREALTASWQAAFDEIQSRITAVETAGGHGAPTLSPQELEQVQGRLRSSLATAIDAAAAQRLAAKKRPPRPNGSTQ